ncbi:hypothetical protein L207DRAFT_517658 [Hyaloscypha variabilis F]|uniref:Uncharacterized protein n=1 Tax=Hyaloscypha variabilis (strain UAMH 11265 / GT02V1 / F) TaxID=1149755 RepID=A0A2J6R508_HYAVF|nr:hypothetical protein L207DRAFT_517658 [Hyaloscypha variabilis F]
MATGQPLENNDPEMFENTAYQELFRLYEGKVVHGTRTLDEAYYQSLTDKELSDRNCDQVVTRRVQRHELNPGKTWTILRVDQLWLWLIDEQTIITSSTHRKERPPGETKLDDFSEDPIIEKIWENLRDERVNRNDPPPPSTALEMSKFIMELSIRLFNSAKCRVGDTRESIHQIFENSINDMAIDEARLFDTFTKKVQEIIVHLEDEKDKKYPPDLKGEGKRVTNLRGTPPKADKNSSGKPKDKKPEDLRVSEEIISNLKSIDDAASLLKETKHIRDGLKILKSILVQQRTVWNDFTGEVQLDNQLKSPPSCIIDEIKNMDDAAERIQTGINSILDLEQNEASISEAITSRTEAQESVRQGRTLMVFTVVSW